MLTKLALSLAAVVTTVGLGITASAQDPEPPPKVVLGTFDSRVVAMAYYRSSEFAESLQEVQVRHTAAVDAGDTEQAEEIAASMQTLQQKVHRQGFGNAPIDGILEKVASRIAELASAQGVDVVVSRWQIVHKNEQATTVDLSFAIGEFFEPSEATRKIMREVAEQPPVPLDELDHTD